MLNKIWIQNKFSLRKSKKTFHQVRDRLLKKKHLVSIETYRLLKEGLYKLDQALKSQDAHQAADLSKSLLGASKPLFKRGIVDYFNEWVLGLALTLLTVTLINQMWFQHYQIPSGSMRPLLLEKDRVIATKTCYGINFPFKASHLYFNPDSLKRGNLAIFTADNLPKEENTARYLFIFNTKKQMVKRVIGKPGDTLYFYGGKIYGLDKNNQPIEEFQHSKAFENLEHIPFINFEGKVTTDGSTANMRMSSPVYLHQMGQIVGKLYANSYGSLQGKFWNGSQWASESPKLEYQDLWGIKNYAMARMLSRNQALEMGFDLHEKDEDYFLELSHSPHTNYPQPHLGVDLYNRLRPMISPEKTLLPLKDEHIKNIKSALVTARFVVKNGFAGNYSIDRSFKPGPYSPAFPSIPDGTYEFFDGVAYKVLSSGKQKKLPQDHPLNNPDAALTQKWFNLGMQMITLFEPKKEYRDYFPSRFAYFRDGALYVMNHEIASSTDSQLSRFVAQEKKKARGFVDYGSPIKDGALNKDLILNYGLKIPNNHYLFLGDNHALSRDCRDFGLIHEKNIQGSPAFIIWPSGSRFGALAQNKIQWLNFSNIAVCSIALFAFAISSWYTRRQRKKEL